MQIERANAKINLYLNVVGRRENGYHDIVSIMQTVSLCDIVTVDYHPGEHFSMQLAVSGNAGVPTDCRNLAWRAAELYLREIGQSGSVTVSIEKHIPMAAGLAGGSADAAAVLRALNRLCGNRLSISELCALGARLGADIPFCIVGGGALVGGIGDVLEQMDPMPPCALVVACRGEGVSTPAAYAALDALYGNFADVNRATDKCTAQIVAQIVAQMKYGDVMSTCVDFYNIFEDVVPKEQPFVNPIKELMLAHGAKRAMMSGSGPSVFGVFATPEEAMAACEALRKTGASAFVCHPRPQYSV